MYTYIFSAYRLYTSRKFLFPHLCFFYHPCVFNSCGELMAFQEYIVWVSSYLFISSKKFKYSSVGEPCCDSFHAIALDLFRASVKLSALKKKEYRRQMSFTSARRSAGLAIFGFRRQTTGGKGIRQAPVTSCSVLQLPSNDTVLPADGQRRAPLCPSPVGSAGAAAAAPKCLKHAARSSRRRAEAQLEFGNRLTYRHAVSTGERASLCCV
jgi:hypothetical protein